MRQLVCMSADVYSQYLNNRYHKESSYLYSNGKKGKGLAAGETERECVRDREWLKIELASVVKTAVGERLTISR
jgi:hypothetical protein